MLEYQYKAQSVLKPGEFRLLNLHAGENSEDLVCNLEVFLLDPEEASQFSISSQASIPSQSPEPAVYDALSYTWGSSAAHCSVMIVEGNQLHAIPVRPNLQAALRQLRHRDAKRYLWVDALCINQGDEVEKSNQVRKMLKIYNKANSVCVWVGPETDDSKIAIDFIKLRLLRENVDQVVKNSDYSRDWFALSRLMRQPWFSRRWIIQEIALAKSAILYCGQDWVDWDDFADAVSLFVWGQSKIQRAIKRSGRYYKEYNQLNDIRESPAARLVYASYNIFRKSEHGHIMDQLLPLEELLCSFSAFETSDPCDTVYAILGIAQDVRPEFKASYNPADGEEISTIWVPSDMIGSPQSFEISPDGESNVVIVRVDQNHEARGTLPSDAGDRAEEDRTLNSTLQNRKRAHSDLSEQNTQITKKHQSATSTSSIPTVAVSDFTNGHRSIAPHGYEGTPATSPVSFPQYPFDPESNDRAFPPDRPQEKDTSATVANQAIEDTNARLQVPNRTRWHADSISSTQSDILVRQTARKIYEQTKRDRVQVDYTKTVGEVCKDAMRFIISRSHSLDMICRPWAPRDPSLPSWILPVTKNSFGLAHNGAYTRVNADLLVGKPGEHQRFYNAAPRSSAQWRMDEDSPGSLTVRGFVLDTVKQKAAPAAAGVVSRNWNELVGWEDASKPPPEPLWRTLVGNRDFLGQKPHKLWKRACQIAFAMRPQGGDLDLKETMSSDVESFVKEYIEKVLRTTWGRRLAILENLSASSSLSLLPPDAKKGDKVCIIYGCSVPVLLREIVCKSAECAQRGECQCAHTNSPRFGKTYKLIGECYVHGMMDGEALLYKRKHPDIVECAFMIG